MKMKGAIALFVKTPGLSPVKTRLAESLDTHTAETFHLVSSRAVSAVIQAVSQQSAVQGYYAVAEQEALQTVVWRDMPSLWQGEGGLGARMGLVYQALLAQHDFVILVGADIPQMTQQQLLQAAEWLANDRQARFSFGSSFDGGFWLFGGNCPAPETLWTDVAYSAADTGVQFLGMLKGLGEVQYLTPLRDVDEACDLVVLHETLESMPHLLPEQRELLHFLDTLPRSLFLNC
jgi:uncharacterized protein